MFHYSIIGGIILSSAVLILSLWAYYYPDSVKTVYHSVVSQYQEKKQARETAKLKKETQMTNLSESEEDFPPTITPSPQQGDISDLNLDDAGNQESAIYSVMLGTSMGPMLYYHQGDSRWGDYLYGGSDPMKKYGCGPTVVSMLINSFSPQQVSVTPVELADWATEHGSYAPQGGSYHNIIQDALTAFGLNAESVRDRSIDRVKELLASEHVLVALMGKGSLTDNGHFIIITDLLDDDNVQIADPNSLDNSSRSWSLQLLLDELKRSYDSGGPLWAVSLPAVPPVTP